MLQRPRCLAWPFIVLAIIVLSFMITSGVQCATPEKPFEDLQEGDTLTAAWLMGTINTLFNWSQAASGTLDLHATNHANHTAATEAHGATGAIMGTTNTQSIYNKTLDSSNSVVGEAIKSGTVPDARVASTICRDSELSSHAATTATHGVSGAIVGTGNTQTLTNKTLGTTNSIDGGAIKTGTVPDARIASTICRDSELGTHENLTAAHGAVGAIVGTGNTQTMTNKTFSSGCHWYGDAVPVANGGTGATTSSAARSNLGANSYDMLFFVPGIYAADEKIIKLVTARAWTLAANTSHKGTVETNPMASVTLAIAKNGTGFGTITVSTGGAVSFSSFSATPFAVGDILSVQVSGSASTLSGLSLSLMGSY